MIIPIYNVEDFLGECLESIVNQTFTDIEIICINDGSTDHSLDILNSYKEKDNRFRIFSQENKGHAVATNKGINLAKGEYLFLMDSDDILDLSALEETYNYAKNKDVDFVIFQSINYVMDEDRYYKSPIYSLEKVSRVVGDKIFNYKDLGDLIFEIPVTPWSKLYKTDFIKRSGAKFPEGLIFDDNVFFFEILFKAERIGFYPKFLFTRRWYTSSSTTLGDGRFLDSIDINNLIIDVFKKNGVFEEYREILFNRKVNLAYYRFRHLQEEYEKIFFEKLHSDFNNNIVSKGLYEVYVNCLNDRNKVILDAAINSFSSDEFKYKVKFWDSKEEKKKLETIITNLKNENKDLKDKNNNLNMELNKIKYNKKSVFKKKLKHFINDY